MLSERSGDRFCPEVEAVLLDLAALSSVQLVAIRTTVHDLRVVRTCRLFDDRGRWTLRVADETVRLADFFLAMDVAVRIEGGVRVVQGRSSIGIVNELRPKDLTAYDGDERRLVRARFYGDP